MYDTALSEHPLLCTVLSFNILGVHPFGFWPPRIPNMITVLWIHPKMIFFGSYMNFV
jgi:hypothetical protein